MEFIQLASIELKKDQTFKPHKHMEENHIQTIHCSRIVGYY